MKLELTDQEAEFLMRALVDNYAEDNQDFESDIVDAGTCGLLIGKLCRESKMIMAFRNARKNKFGFKDRITDYLFMGAGWHSCVAKNKLHKRIEYAVSVLGGLQQNGGMGTDFDEESDKQDKQALKEIALDVLTAFGLTVEDLK
jgi:hypothetical protein